MFLLLLECVWLVTVLVLGTFYEYRSLFYLLNKKQALLKDVKKHHIINIVDDDYYIEDESHDYDDDDVVVGVVEGFRDYDDVVVVA